MTTQSIIRDERTIADIYHAGQLDALWLALQVRLNPWCDAAQQRRIAALVLLDLSEEHVQPEESAAVTAMLAGLVGMTPAQLSELVDEIDAIGALIYTWYEDCPLVDAVAAVERYKEAA